VAGDRVKMQIYTDREVVDQLREIASATGSDLSKTVNQLILYTLAGGGTAWMASTVRLMSRSGRHK